VTSGLAHRSTTGEAARTTMVQTGDSRLGVEPRSRSIRRPSGHRDNACSKMCTLSYLKTADAAISEKLLAQRFGQVFPEGSSVFVEDWSDVPARVPP